MFFPLILLIADDYIFAHHVIYPTRSIGLDKVTLGKFNHSIHVHKSFLYVEDGRIFEATWLADLESSTVGEKNVCSNIRTSFHGVHDSFWSESKMTLGYFM